MGKKKKYYGYIVESGGKYRPHLAEGVYMEDDNDTLLNHIGSSEKTDGLEEARDFLRHAREVDGIKVFLTPFVHKKGDIHEWPWLSFMEAQEWESMVGKTIEKRSGKPFKGGKTVAIAKAITTNPHSGKEAFELDNDSVVDCYQCKLKD